MTAKHEIVKLNNNNEFESWVPTTLDKINKDETFLERIISENPSLLQLESRQTGIKGPYIIYRQISFQTPQNRTIIPDIVILTGSGHIVVVEVKRYINDELKDRRVISQIVDYAASFSALNTDEISKIFNKTNSSTSDWGNIVYELFPNENDCEELASLFLSKLESGNINLIIACDKAPLGINELIKGISKQSTLEFDLKLLEITPYIRNNVKKESEILFVPKTKLATEIVARTAITVIYRQEDKTPSVDIKTTSIEEIEEKIDQAKKGAEGRRLQKWSHDLLTEEIQNLSAELNKKLTVLLDWAVENDFFIESKTILPTFGLCGKNHGQFITIPLQENLSINLRFNEKYYFGGAQARNNLIEELKAINILDKNINPAEIAESRILAKRIAELNTSQLEELMSILGKYCQPDSQ
jgi:hypothetical protein